MTDDSQSQPGKPDRQPSAEKPKPKPKPKPRAKPKPTAASPVNPDANPAPSQVADSPAEPVEATSPTPASPAASTAPVNSPASGAEAIPATTSASDAAVDAEFAEESSGGSYLLFTALPSWLTSTIIHVIVLLALALLTLPPITRPKRDNELVLGDNDDSIETIEQFEDQAIDSVEIADTGEVAEMIVENDLITETPLISDAMEMTSAALKIDLNPCLLYTSPSPRD